MTKRLHRHAHGNDQAIASSTPEEEPLLGSFGSPSSGEPAPGDVKARIPARKRAVRARLRAQDEKDGQGTP